MDNSSITESMGAEKSILVVDDDRLVRESLVRELSRNNYQVMSACGGAEAMEILHNNTFDAMISDVRMPGMSGVELMNQVSTLNRNMVRILLTAYTDDDALEAAWASGGVYKLEKPWTDSLHIVLRRALEQRESLEQERAQRKEAQKAVMHLDRMASLGTLAAGIAHELRSPLSYLQANFDWCLSEVERFGHPPDASRVTQEFIAELQQVAQDCHTGILRLGEIIEGLRAYAAPKRDFHPVDIRHCVTQAVRIVMYKYKHDVEIATELPSRPLMVNGHEGEIGQIIINLLINGIQAMDEVGRISVRVVERAPHVVVEVEDSGPGVPDNVVPRLFETFFTTKEGPQGNGLGLAVSREIAERHGGHLRYIVRPPPGALFVLELPVLLSTPKGN